MHTVAVAVIGVVLAVAGTMAFDLTVHAGSYVFSGWQRYVVVAAGGAVSAIVIWRALRSAVKL